MTPRDVRSYPFATQHLSVFSKNSKKHLEANIKGRTFAMNTNGEGLNK